MAIEHRAEVCVVGAGPAGALIADHLASRGQQVIVLEHGPALDRLAARARAITELAIQPLEAQIDPAYRQPCATPAPAGSRAYSYARVSAVGGSSLHWAGYCPRPLERDLAAWPIGWSELEPWLVRAERALGVAGAGNPYASPRSAPYPLERHPATRLEERFVAPAAARLGWQVHAQPVAIASAPYEGRAACRRCGTCSVCPTGARYSADLVHVPRMLRGGARLLTGMHARRLELDRARRRADVLVAEPTTGEREEHLVRAERYVLAAGGVETPRLLLLSRIGASDRTGRGFADHAFTVTQLVVDADVGWGASSHACATDHFRAGTAEQGSFHLVFIRDPQLGELVQREAMSGALSVERLRASARGAFLVLGSAELEGNGAVELDPERLDRHGDPIPRVTLPLRARDERTLRAMSDAVRALAGALGARGAPARESALDFGWGAHPMGGCAMGATPEHGVVDRDAKVFGVDNLFVAGSAVFPGFGSANPTLTLAALALRLAAHLGSDG